MHFRNIWLSDTISITNRNGTERFPLNNREFPRVSTSLQDSSDINSAVVFMVSIHLQTFNSSTFSSNYLGSSTKSPTLISPSITIFHCLHCHLRRSRYLFIFSFSFIFIPVAIWRAKSTSWRIIFLLINSRSGPLTGNRWSVYISKSQRILWFYFSR